MPPRTTCPRIRARALATATAVLAAALLLSGCKDGMGVRDEGPSGVSPTSSVSTGSTP
ncbi:hypothetical protein OG588_28675 [Streptomyces prunicolor]|uniref:hypothetical protein n=1 Tax=Streptomyces prunicolor TaxID=67348 RepID=UPI003866616E|nr:hypothetical protein OG588_28675 [Streptomyces prunicolor]